MEESEFEDILDDWFIESLKTYKDLHVYQLEHPTQVIEWTSGKTVCVAGCRPSKNEILELRLPLKLFADENKGLCAERDFKVVHGGFTDVPVHCLRHIPGTRCLVTSDGVSAHLQVWDLGGDDSDVIRRTGSVSRRRRSHTEGGTRIAAPPTSLPQILHGAQSCDVRLSQLTSGQTLYDLECDSADPLSSLLFLSGDVFLAGCSNGNIYFADTRTSAAPQLSPPPASLGESALWWTADASAGPDPYSSRVVRLSSSAEVVVTDMRNPGVAVGRAQLDVATRGCSLDDVTLSWSPVLKDCLAVSGFSGNVLVFNSSLWGAELQEARPLFEHRGHTVSSSARSDALVTSHVWHPDRARTLLSAASDGSVHVWDWVDHSDGAT
ncbi:WD repeat-containing protein 73 [Solea senegalensis]|uniref:WD repeat-containing protein 73 n=1 Tax=Solea senegalensis TaxID=28829 RepID=A0AAV6PE84_SOLSE|nr:WD repeat-containing protein 73-like [Solea senegalensis]XP_043873543.1 WD repeat-containing protein 73-like [Solea senegalensis]KAG7454897.1 WD repeat-containing protein 73 [Solea senegalensis]KAG7472988.1 WD repeat-containing protein 73 [Solea senegalensis]